MVTGYGNIPTCTGWARGFTAVYSLIGIPLMLTVLNNLGKILIQLTTAVKTLIRRLLRKIRLKRQGRPSIQPVFYPTSPPMSDGNVTLNVDAEDEDQEHLSIFHGLILSTTWILIRYC